ncbi:RRQRL motif-containing zinc-binding protein [Streptosporangium sp. NPDC023615]|uniref:RRQRL motif-containing zinc-binding protein n=1 Tax=Streptosporangium sp. NPDC023615 TaxID=3154794 RepID=UPI0034463817
MSRRQRKVFYDPTGRKFGGLPTYPWRFAPDGLATRRQLRAAGLRPGGQAPCAQVMWRSRRAAGGVAVAYLYDVAAAKPRRTPSTAQLQALGKAMRARRTCPDCGTEQSYCIPTRYGACLPCHGWGLTA